MGAAGAGRAAASASVVPCAVSVSGDGRVALCCASYLCVLAESVSSRSVRLRGCCLQALPVAMSAGKTVESEWREYRRQASGAVGRSLSAAAGRRGSATIPWSAAVAADASSAVPNRTALDLGGPGAVDSTRREDTVIRAGHAQVPAPCSGLDRTRHSVNNGGEVA